MQQIKVPEEQGFNGSTTMVASGRLLIYRVPPYLCSILLDDRWQASPESHRKIDLWKNDDPRLVHHGGELYLSTSYWGRGFSQERVELRSVRLENGSPFLRVIGKFDTIEEDPSYVRVREKNWAPFSHEGELFYVHQALPHRILKVDIERGVVRMVHSSHWLLPTYWKEGWGSELRLNAPPFRLNSDCYLSTLHTCKRGGYRTWFYTFAARPPFEVLAVGARPAIYPIDASGRNPYNGRHRCIFITGMEVDQASDSVILTGGNNDHAVIRISFSLYKILSSMRPVQCSGEEAPQLEHFPSVVDVSKERRHTLSKDEQE